MAKFVDIVDEDDNFVRKEERAIVHRDNLLHREISLFFITTDKKIVFQIRTPQPPVYVLPVLEATAGGHVDPGENAFDAALRETLEETGYEVNPDDVVTFGKIRIKEEFESLGIKNNVMRSVFAVPFKGAIESLKGEEGKSVGFITLSLDEILNPSVEFEKNYWFIPSLRSPQMLDLYKKMLELA